MASFVRLTHRPAWVILWIIDLVGPWLVLTDVVGDEDYIFYALIGAILNDVLFIVRIILHTGSR